MKRIASILTVLALYRAQRQGDAFVEIIELAAGSKDVPSEGGERPHVAVTMSLETLTRETGTAALEAGGYVDAASAHFFARNVVTAARAASARVPSRSSRANSNSRSASSTSVSVIAPAL